MFISYNLWYNLESARYEFKIVDSGFISSVMSVKFWGQLPCVIGAEYQERGLKVGKNMALVCLYMEEKERISIDDLIVYLNNHAAAYISNYKDVAFERDRYLDKFSAMK